MPANSVYLPALQREHEATPAELNLPFTQSTHAVEAERFSEYFPPMHEAQPIEAEEENIPAVQMSHSKEPIEELNFPASQSTHAACPADPAYFPAIHEVHVELALALDFPRGQREQVEHPTSQSETLSEWVE